MSSSCLPRPSLLPRATPEDIRKNPTGLHSGQERFVLLGCLPSSVHSRAPNRRTSTRLEVRTPGLRVGLRTPIRLPGRTIVHVSACPVFVRTAVTSPLPKKETRVDVTRGIRSTDQSRCVSLVGARRDVRTKISQCSARK